MSYIRLKTLEVSIGDLKMGGQNPIRVQSMTTADTMNTSAVVDECIRLINAGCEMIRITAPSIKEAENLLNIKNELKKRGYSIPLCADIHYTPNAAEVAARIVEKVRINPGNYADKKKFELKEYSDAEYNAELERIREKFLPLVRVCKEYGTAMRIGTNHGSLSDRILSRYGDTPLGMVESAMEFIRICEDENFHNIVISMKASNPLVMIEAYRLLVDTMIKNNKVYPIHLGVTEAGDGEDGRIKSAIGIGTLLEDGIGDTVRVSLTEPPEYEIPAAQKLVAPYNEYRLKHLTEIDNWLLSDHLKWHITSLPKLNKTSSVVKNIGNENVPIVIHSLAKKNDDITPANLFSAGYIYNVQSDKWNITDFAADYVYIQNKNIPFDLPGNIGIIQDYEVWIKNPLPQHYPLIKYEQLSTVKEFHKELNFIELSDNHLNEVQLPESKNNVVIIEIEDTFFSDGYLAEKLKLFYERYSQPIKFS